MGKIAQELKDLITEVTSQVVAKFVKGPDKASEPEVLVFFHKMEGDYNRYGADITVDDEKKAFSAKAKECYSTAFDLCVVKAKDDSGEDVDQLLSTNPIRLGLALNYSVFTYEILEGQDAASQMAKEAFESAIGDLDNLDEADYRDSTLIMQLLKDNLHL